MRTFRTNRNTVTPAVTALAAGAAIALASGAASAQQVVSVQESAMLRAQLASIRSSTPTPALAAAVVVDGRVFWAVNGRRRADLADGGMNAVQRDDRFYIGSVAKPYTAMALARAVDAGHIAWNSTIGGTWESLFPNDTTANRYRYVTLSQLLSHTSGMWYTPNGMPSGDYAGSFFTDYQRRYFYTAFAVSDPAVCATAGECVNYDGGAIIGSTMFEARAGLNFAQYMRDELFTPLGMTRSEALPSATSDILQWVANPEVLPHSGDAASGFEPRSFTANRVRWMVGSIASSIVDMARLGYAATWPAGASTHVISRAAQDTLETTVGRGNFSPGWVVFSADRADGLELWHNGSFGQNYASIRVWPTRGIAIAVATNSNTPAAVNAAEAWIIDHLQDTFGAAPIANVDVIDGTPSARVAATVNDDEAANARDRDYNTAWTTNGATTSATLTLRPPLRIVLPGAPPPTFGTLRGLFLDEADTVAVPGFVQTDNQQGTPYQFPINRLEVRAYDASGVQRYSLTSSRVGRRRRISLPSLTGIARVEVEIASVARARLTEVHLLD